MVHRVGDAADRFDVEFVDPPGVGGYGLWDSVSDEVRDELVKRTPCFLGWQTERWFTHCGDAAAYLGRGGHAELVGPWAPAVSYIRAEARMDEEQWEDYSRSLARDGDCSAYVFRCLHCGALGGYSDCN